MRYLIPLCLIAFLATPSSAENWLRFRGPNGAGRSADKQIPTTWSTKENLKWKAKLPGRGASSPIIVGERVFLTCFSGYGGGGLDSQQSALRRHVVCLNKADGKIVWDKKVKPVLPEDSDRGQIAGHGFASSTPVSDGKQIYVFFGKTGVLAYDLKGNQKWQVSVGTNPSPRGWGSAASPVLYKNLVIVNAIVEGEAIVALDKTSGKVVWRAKAPGYNQCWSTPLLVKVKDKTELVINVPNEIWGLNPDSGKLKWYADVLPGGAMCTSMVAKDGIVYAIGGRRAGGAAVRVGGQGDVTKSHVVWQNNIGSYVTSPVVQGDHLYWVSDRGVATCVSTKSGKEVFRQRINAPGRVYASVTLANGKLYAVTRYDGVFVFAAKPKYKQIAHNRLAGDESIFNASPVVVDSQLFLRSDRYLYCVAKKK